MAVLFNCVVAALSAYINLAMVSSLKQRATFFFELFNFGQQLFLRHF